MSACELLTYHQPQGDNGAVPPKRRTAPDFREVGEFLKAARKLAGLTQDEVIQASGLGSQAVSEAERGFNVRVETLTKYAKALGYTDAVAMFQDPKFKRPNDDLSRALWRAWGLLEDNEVRRDAVRLVAGKIADEPARSATSSERSTPGRRGKARKAT